VNESIFLHNYEKNNFKIKKIYEWQIHLGNNILFLVLLSQSLPLTYFYLFFHVIHNTL